MIAKAKYLAAASVLEYVVQLAVPVILVRLLTQDDFASYRFIGLAGATIVGTLMLGVPQSLYYFVPRKPKDVQVAYMLQSAALCMGLGVLWALVAAALFGLAPSSAFSRLVPHEGAPLFIAYLALFAGSAVLDAVAAAKGDIEVQAAMNGVSALLRVIAVLAGAWMGAIWGVLAGLCAFALVRWAMFAWYVARQHERPHREQRALAEQVRYTLPWGIANGLFVLRTQAEQWVGASMLNKVDYVALSVAASLPPLTMFVSKSITSSIMAEMNRLEARGDYAQMLKMHADANLVRVVLVFPAVAVLAATARPLLSLIYTPAYAHGAIVVQLLCLGVIGCIIEMSSLARAMRLGRLQMTFDAAMLMLSLSLSIALTHYIGLMGTVVGSVVGLWVATAFGTAMVVSRLPTRLRDFQHWGRLGRCLLACVVGSAAGLLVERFVTHPWPPLPAFALGGAVAFGVHVAVARALGISTLRPLRNIERRDR